MKVMFSPPPAPTPAHHHQHLQQIGKLCETRRMNSFPFSSLLLTLIKHMFTYSDVCSLRSRPCVRNVCASTFIQFISEAITDVNSFPRIHQSTNIGFGLLASGNWEKEISQLQNILMHFHFDSAERAYQFRRRKDPAEGFGSVLYD